MQCGDCPSLSLQPFYILLKENHYPKGLSYQKEQPVIAIALFGQ